MNSVFMFIMDYLVTGMIGIVLFLIITIIYCLYYRGLRSEPFKLMKFGYKCQSYGNKKGEANKIRVIDFIVMIALWPIVIIVNAKIIDDILSEL